MHTKTSVKKDIPWYTTRERCITILYHAIENTVAVAINATYARRVMGGLGAILASKQRLSCILIGCMSFSTP